MESFNIIYCCDFDLSRQEEIGLVGSAIDALRRKNSKMTISDEIAIGAALETYMEGIQDLPSEEQEELDKIEERLGIMAVWIDLENVWVRQRGRIRPIPLSV